ncbi:MAG: hypothetical protein U5J82_00420 [Desulfobacterales bacterium]|nr:hypothetical protein [Desulfobacterales bacterium]
MVFLLAGLPLERLAEKIVDQLILPRCPPAFCSALVRDASAPDSGR